MTVSIDSERRVVPRWREFHKTVGLGELKSAHGRARNVDSAGILAEKVLEWKTNRNIALASELVSTAMIVGKLDLAWDAIEFLKLSPEASELVKSSTSRLENGFVDAELSNPLWSNYYKIACLKRVLKKWPRNPIVWIELALMYCREGVERKASQCISTALYLAPDNRYVLRCAARFFVHLEDPERASALLRSSVRTRHDSWLLSAEIAASQIADKRSPLLKTATKVLSSKRIRHRDTTELAASLGTQELVHGASKVARRLFKLSAIDPNDNVKAQIQWVLLNHKAAAPNAIGKSP